MNDFNKLKTTIVGNIGEEYINEFSSHFGCKPYTPSISQSNPVDSLNACKNKKKNKWDLVSIEIKTKPRLIYYPKTGFDKNDFEEYKEFPTKVCVVFVDYLEKSIYYQWISELEKHKEVMNGHLVVFPLSIMKKYRDLTDDEVELLKKHCNSNYL